VQTLENNPALIHGGPFANIAHGCNSVIATKSAMKLVDYVVTEAGFGADLGAEKFIDTSAASRGCAPGRVDRRDGARDEVPRRCDLKTITQENLEALEKGITNLERHVETCRRTTASLRGSRSPFQSRHAQELIFQVEDREARRESRSRDPTGANGGKGGPISRASSLTCASRRATSSSSTTRRTPLWEKINKIAKKSTREQVTADAKVRGQIKKLQEDGYRPLPGVRREDAVLVLDRPAAARRTTNHVVNVARGAPRLRRRVAS